MTAETPAETQTLLRSLLGIGYLLTVCLFAGLLADQFRYPSLFGSAGSVFAEYAYPLPFNWALAHLCTMLPLAVFVAAMPTWRGAILTRFRWIMIVLIVLILVIEVKLPYGRLNKNPFLLFGFVDALTALVISLAFHSPLKVMASVAGALGLVVVSTFVILDLRTPNEQCQACAETRTSDNTDFFSDISVAPDHGSKQIVFSFYVAGKVSHGQAPLPETICDMAREKLPELIGVGKPMPGYQRRIDFWVSPGFETNPAYAWPAGGMSQEASGNWRCNFSHPEPETSP